MIFPPSVSTIGPSAFSGFPGTGILRKAFFLGNAPTLGENVFKEVGAGFTTYHLSGSSGFSTPTWEGYPAVELGEVEVWLLGYGLPYDTELDQDLSGDGVTLLTAYALDLDPNLNLIGHLPAPIVESGALSIRFYAARPDIVYRVESSRDLKIWGVGDVTLSGLGPDNHVTASVERTHPKHYLRLVLEQSTPDP